MIDPNAIIAGRKNYKKGVISRSKIIQYLRKNYMASSREMAEKLGISYSAVYYHLRILKLYKIVKKEGRKWRLLAYPQHTLTEYMGSKLSLDVN